MSSLEQPATAGQSSSSCCCFGGGGGKIRSCCFLCLAVILSLVVFLGTEGEGVIDTIRGVLFSGMTAAGRTTTNRGRIWSEKAFSTKPKNNGVGDNGGSVLEPKPSTGPMQVCYHKVLPFLKAELTEQMNWKQNNNKDDEEKDDNDGENRQRRLRLYTRFLDQERSFCMHPCVQTLMMQQTIRKNSPIWQKDWLSSGYRHETKETETSRKSTILVVSHGGTASTFVMSTLQQKPFSMSTNNIHDKYDHLKHVNLDHLFGPRFKGQPPRTIYENELVSEYARILYIVGDAAQAIFHMYRHNKQADFFARLNKTFDTKETERPVLPQAWKDNITALFDASATSGYDVFGMGRHTQQWIYMQNYIHFAPDGTNAKNGAEEGSETGNVTRTNSTIPPAVTPNIRETIQRLVPVTDLASFPPLLITDVASIVENPLILASFLEPNNDNHNNNNNPLGRMAADIAHHFYLQPKWAQQWAEERHLLQITGALPLYLQLRQEWLEAVAQNYLLFAIRYFDCQ